MKTIVTVEAKDAYEPTTYTLPGRVDRAEVLVMLTQRWNDLSYANDVPTTITPEEFEQFNEVTCRYEEGPCFRVVARNEDGTIYHVGDGCWSTDRIEARCYDTRAEALFIVGSTHDNAEIWSARLLEHDK